MKLEDKIAFETMPGSWSYKNPLIALEKVMYKIEFLNLLCKVIPQMNPLPTFVCWDL
jgi:hypothetical protein